MSDKVTVWGKTYDVETYQKSKSVWIASGEYMGELKSVKASSKGSAVIAWRRWAEYKGNG